MKKALVSLPSSFPAKWVGVIWNKTKSLGIDGCVFHGIPTSSVPQINNAEYEARQDMYTATCVFAAMAKQNSGEITGDWLIRYLPVLKEKKVDFQLGLVGIGVADAPELQEDSILANMKIFQSAEEWLDYLFKELEKWR